MSDRIVQALVNIKNHDTLVVIGHTAKPHQRRGSSKGHRTGPTLLKTLKLADAGE